MHLAWLHASPDFKKLEPNKSNAQPSRMVQFDETFVCEIPDTGEFKYLFNLLSRIGIAEAGFNGAVPITMRRINDWCCGVGVDLYPTEKEMMVRMSEAYVSHLRKSEHPGELPPAAIIDNEGSVDQDYIARKVMLQMGG